jgi:alkylhydroperoxidase family enzyme
MRLTPIEQPSHLITRFAFRRMERQFGKVATPMKVIYARKPRLLPLLMMIDRTANHGLSIDPELRLLVLNVVDRQNECGFCNDYRLAIAVQRRMGADRFAALADFRTSELFTPRERAALAYADEVTDRRQASDETFAELKRHFTDVEIVELTWLVAIENYFNLMKLSLQLGSDGLQELAEQQVAGRRSPAAAV